MADDLVIWLLSQNNPITVMKASPPRRSSTDVAIRVKNRSTSYTAVGVTVSVTGTSAAFYLMSVDGEDTFTATASIGDLAPNAVSDAVVLRRVIPSTAALGTHTCTLRATPTSWIAGDAD